jgi:hypothetical protein
MRDDEMRDAGVERRVMERAWAWKREERKMKMKMKREQQQKVNRVQQKAVL